jgi:hypothetical protein
MQPMKLKQGNNMPFESLWRKRNRLKAGIWLLNWSKGRLGTLREGNLHDLRFPPSVNLGYETAKSGFSQL